MMTNENERTRRPSDYVELKLTVNEAQRRQLKMLAAEAGCSMSDFVAEWISTTWKHSPTFQERMRREGRWWTDERGALRNPDGSLYQARTHRDEREGGAR